MSTLAPLAMHAVLASATPWLVPAGVIPLPAAVESAAFTVADPEGLRVFINRPGTGRTLQLRIGSDRLPRELPSLPLVAAGATTCGPLVLVTGADPAGVPLAVALDAQGAIAWQTPITGPPPSRWPLPGCLDGPMALWQTRPGKLEVADLGPAGLTGQRSFPVGGPPLELALGAGAAWALWTASGAPHGLAVRGAQAAPFALPVGRADSVAIGAWTGGVAVAWVLGSTAYLAPLDPATGRVGAIEETDLGDTAGGTLALVPGPRPLLWAQRRRGDEGEAVSWTSRLSGPAGRTIAIDGLVYAIAWWGDLLVVLGTSELWLLRAAGGGGSSP